MRQLILAISFILLAFGVRSQDDFTYKYYDSLTFVLYEQEAFTELISTGKKALKAGFDSYYFRARLGISYYELGNYEQAITQLKKALTLNTNPVVLEYLYFAELFSGRREEARLLLCRHEEALRHLGLKCADPAESLYLEGGVKQSNRAIREIGDITFYHAGIRSDIGSRVSLYQGYSHIRQQFYNYSWVNIQGNGRGPAFQSDSVEMSTKYLLYQHEYYVAGSIQLLKGFFLYPAFHYQGMKDLDDNYAWSVTVMKRVPYTQLSATYTGSAINGYTQRQTTGSVIVYPLGNLHLYLQGDVTLHSQDDVRSMVYYNKVGVKVFSFLWAEGFYGWGDLYNFSDQNAFYLFNIPDVLYRRYGGSLSFLIKGVHQLNIGYLLENKRTAIGANYQHSGFYSSLKLVF